MTKAVLGWTDLTQGLHLPFCTYLQTVPPRRKLALMPREHFKTTVAMSLGIHLTIQPKDHNLYIPGLDGRNSNILFAAQTATKAQNRIGWIRRQFETNELLYALWPDHLWRDVNRLRVPWNNSEFTLPRSKDSPDPTFASFGVEGAATGGHYDVIIEDDLIGLEDANSDLGMSRAIEWHKAARSLSKDPATYLNFIFGTRWAVYDLYSYIQDKDKRTDVYIRSVIENGVPIFPERFTMEEIEERRVQKGDLFYLNYMNSVVGSSLQDFDPSLIRPFERLGDYIEFDDLEPVDTDAANLYNRPTPTLQPSSPRAKLLDDTEAKDTPIDREHFRVLRGPGGVRLLRKWN